MSFAAGAVLLIFLLAGPASAQETQAPAEDLFAPGLVAPSLDFEVPAEIVRRTGSLRAA